MSLTPEQRKKLELLKLEKQLSERLRLAFDYGDLSSRPTPAQMDIIRSTTPINFVVGSNRSGKTALGGRIVTWWFNGDHPYMKRPDAWGDKPIKIMMMGQDTRNINFEIIPEKIKPFIGTEGVDYKVKRDGGNISAITNLKNGNVIVFMSHSDAEQARRRGQGFTAQIVWLDEMPSISSILTELMMRVATTQGFMYTTFTPLIRNDEIRKIVDSADGIKTKKWLISILDNPSMTQEARDELEVHWRKISGSEAEFRARMYGDWLASETLVFKFDSDHNKRDPDGYDSRLWPHVAVVDPAASGLAGFTVWAREPNRDVWYCVLAKHIQGSAFSEMVPYIETLLQPFNIVKRICDCNPSGFYKEAAVQGIKYQPITEKAFNKENMIDACNNALLTKQVFMGTNAQQLIDELTSCSRAEDNPERIIKASKYHTADTFRYFIHLKPPFKTIKAEPPVEERIRRNWKEKLQNDAVRAKMEEQKAIRTKFRSFRNRRRII